MRYCSPSRLVDLLRLLTSKRCPRLLASSIINTGSSKTNNAKQRTAKQSSPHTATMTKATTKASLPTFWERVEITKSNNAGPATVLSDALASWDGKTLYLGHKAQWSLRAKHVTRLQVEGDVQQGSRVTVTLTTNDKVVSLVGALDEGQWSRLWKQALPRFAKHVSVPLEQPRRAKSPSKQSLSPVRAKTTTARPKALTSFVQQTGSLRFSPSRQTRRDASPVRSPVRRVRTFGKSRPQRTVNLLWDDTEETPVPPQASRISLPSTAERDEPELLVYTDDDDNEGEDANQGAPVPNDKDDDDDLVFDEAPAAGRSTRFAESDDEQASPKAVTAMPTTPVRTSQRHVSPASRTQAKAAAPPATIHAFFTAKATAAKPSSFDPAARAIPVAPATPVRTPKVRKANASWLSTTRAGLVSPKQKRQQDLFADDHQSFQTPIAAAIDDPIEEYAAQDPLAVLDEADKDPRQQQRLSFSLAINGTSLARKRKRHLFPHQSTPPRRLLPVRERTASYEAPRLSPWKGLQNLGNTCYLNASLQMLVTLAGTKPSHGNWWNGLRGKGGPLTTSLLAIVDQLQEAPTVGPRLSSLNPRAVKEAMDFLTDKFRGYEQRDAHEFLNDLIDSVHEELEKGPTAQVKDTEGVGAENPSVALGSEPGTEALVPQETTPADGSTPERALLPTDDFRLTVEVCLQCVSCQYSRSKQEMYRHLSLDIVTGDSDTPMAAMASITAGLAQFFQPEVREIRCEKCAEGTHASQSMRVLSW
jgi:hypothetical protein